MLESNISDFGATVDSCGSSGTSRLLLEGYLYQMVKNLPVMWETQV